MTKDMAKGWVVGKRLKGHDHPYPIVINDFAGDRNEFVRGMRLAGCSRRVEFAPPKSLSISN